MEPITVMIADDHPVVRDGIKFMLQTSSRLQVVAEAWTGIDALEAVRVFRPSVVLMDISMPDMDGLEATRRIREQFPGTSVLVMTMHDDEVLVADAVRAGVAGYLLKTTPCEELCHAVESVARGEITIKASLLHRALGTLRGAARDKKGEPARSAAHRNGSELTERERAVLALLAEGKTNKQIGARLFISPGTAKKHVESILAKLDASDRTDAAAMAVRLGLVQ